MSSVSPLPALLLAPLLLAAGACQPTPRVERGKAKIVRQIRQAGLEYTAREFRTQAREGELENVRLFLEAGMEPDIRRHWRANLALYEASREGRDEVAELLLDHGASVDGRSARLGKTPLMAAAQNGHRSTVQLLLEHRAEVNARTEDRRAWTALHFAAHDGRPRIVRLLLAHDADPTLGDAEDRTALDLAREHRREAVIELLESL